MNYRILIDVIGWLGSILVVAAYVSVSYERMKINPWLFQVLNAIGSLCLITNTIYYRAYPSATVNVVWLVIASFALWKIKIKKTERQ